eukprot:763340-Hanusia_phi.AAC.2
MKGVILEGIVDELKAFFLPRLPYLRSPVRSPPVPESSDPPPLPASAYFGPSSSSKKLWIRASSIRPLPRDGSPEWRHLECQSDDGLH